MLAFRYSVIAASSSGTLRKTPRRMGFSVISRNQRSTRLSQEDEVGMKCTVMRGCLGGQVEQGVKKLDDVLLGLAGQVLEA